MTDQPEQAATEADTCPCLGIHHPSATNCRWCKCHRSPLREQVAEALRTTPSALAAATALGFPSHHQPGESGYLGWCALCVNDIDALADTVLAVIQPELDRLDRTAEDRARRITNLTAERTQLRARLAEQEEETMRQHDRAEQAEQEANATATAAAHLTTLVRERAERAEAAIARVQDAAALHRKQLISTAELYAVIGAALQSPAPAHNAGPTVTECRADDLRWPLQKHGE
ncbi:hypothetical protein AB0N14_13635 [Streptomyces sp. NPDC051104]|uniref:hypothetical protein n=1 Tax=Streptomyces sp. NPDC051104 TaxID=3155044 RepID=UPI003443629B